MSLDKKILVIDDSQRRIKMTELAFPGKVIAPALTSWDPKLRAEISYEVRVASIEQALRAEEYAVICMDGNLGLNLEGQYFDGGVVSRKLRAGEYGPLNQNTLMLNSSSHYENPFTKGSIDLDYEHCIKSLAKYVTAEIKQEDTK